MTPYHTDPVVYLGPVCAVVRVRPNAYEIRVHNGTHSLLAGTRDTEAGAIRTAQRLERSPDNTRRFVGASL